MDPDPPLFLLASIFNPLSLNVVIGLAVVSILLFLSAFISGAEVAYFSISIQDKEILKQSKLKSATYILQLLHAPKKLLATILIANNFINVGIVVISSYLATAIFNFTNFTFFGISVSVQLQEFLIIVVLVTFLILLIGEVIPKVYANKYAIQFAAYTVYPLLVLEKIFWWIGLSRFLLFSTSIIDQKFIKKTNNISVDELSHALELTSDQDVSKEDHKILEGIVKFGNTDVKQIMKPRVDVVAFDVTTSYQEIMTEIVKVGYSRIPIYEENFDTIVGVLYVKDLLAFLNEKDTFQWQKLIRDPYFIPESKKIDDLLKEFQETRVHLAVVVDEYGGNSGIITLEDIIEEIVGDITDEFDEEDISFKKIDDSNYVFEGKTPLKDIYRVLDIEGEIFEENKGDSDTIAGFLLELSGKIMMKHEKISFENYTFTIEASDRRRIKKIRITINNDAIII